MSPTTANRSPFRRNDPQKSLASFLITVKDLNFVKVYCLQNQHDHLLRSPAGLLVLPGSQFLSHTARLLKKEHRKSTLEAFKALLDRVTATRKFIDYKIIFRSFR